MQPAFDCAMMDAQGSANLALRPTDLVQNMRGFDTIIVGMEVATHALVSFAVAFACHHYQIIGRVVGAIAVSMMNYLVRVKRATEHLFSNDAVLIQTSLSALADDAIATASDMTTFPIRMIWSISGRKLPLGDGGLLKLVKACWTEGLITQSSVLLGSHAVGYSKMAARNLHTTNQTAKLTLDGIFHLAPPRGIIPQREQLCNLCI